MPTKVAIKVNPDLAKERQAVSFNVEEFACWFYGGWEKLRERREIEKQIFDDPNLAEDDVPIENLSYQDMYDNTVKKYLFLVKKLKTLQNEKDPNGSDIYPGLLTEEIVKGVISQGDPFLLNQVMFIPTINGQGTPKQIEKWMPKILNFEIIGTYAQTELGHGTFLRGLETRADYDINNDEFVLHSPTITAYKWWPGGLGHTVNHAVVPAQLYIAGKQHGIQMFFVQLRDTKTHMPLPGVKIGDIGCRRTFQTANNGFLGFEKFRIPRTNMLMKNAQVHEDGRFVRSPASVLTYFTMVQVRVHILTFAYKLLTKAATIATRYSVVRRQGKLNPKEPEQQIIDYLTQQLKLFPQIAKGLVFKLNADYLVSMLKAVEVDLHKGDLRRLPEMHALASCLKAISTNDSSASVETLLLACGGHGHMLASGLPLIYDFATAQKTYEGENTVLLLQTARFLMKAWASALKGEELVPTVMYLNEATKSQSFINWDRSWKCIVKAIQFVAANKIRIAFKSLEMRKKQNMIFEEAFNLTSIELAAAAEIHGRSFLASTALYEIQSANVSKNLSIVLNDLLELYLVDLCLQKMDDILRFIELSEKDISDLQDRLEKSLAKIRTNAVGIVDGFDYHDRILRSVLGSFDGNVYERIFESAQKCPMNKVPVQKSFEEHLKPFVKSNM